MKKILGLDIGTSSIGWAIVETEDDNLHNDSTTEELKTAINISRKGIHKDAVGVRIITQEEMHRRFIEGKKLNDFKGQTLTPTAKRRKYRGARRIIFRYKLRRDKLLTVLEILGMKPEGSFIYDNIKKRWIDDKKNSKWYTKEKFYTIDNFGNKKKIKREDGDIGRQLYELRDKAVKEMIDLKDWGRIMIQLNQYRGYSSDRFSKDENNKFDYYTAQVVEFDPNKYTPFYDDNEKDENGKPKLKYNSYKIILKTDDEIEYGYDEIPGPKKIFEGLLFYPSVEFKKGDFITIKKPELIQEKRNKKIINKYYKITLTKPDPKDWNYKYQNLHKTLTEWCEAGGTVGTYFFKNYYLAQSISRIRNNIVNRDWYEQEFEAIWKMQYPKYKKQLEEMPIAKIVEKTFKDEKIRQEILRRTTFEEQLKYLIKDKIIFFQRDWQQKNGKGRCIFENIPDVKKPGGHIGRPVIPRSHPLHQEFKIWQQINNVRIWVHPLNQKPIELMGNNNECFIYLHKYPYQIKELLYDELQNKKERSWRTFVNDTLSLNLKINKEDKSTGANEGIYYSVNYIKISKKGQEQDNKLKGNTTLCSIRDILSGEVDENWYQAIHNKTGIENLLLLWELIYDKTIRSPLDVANNIKKHFPELEAKAESLSKIVFADSGMGNLSAKAIRNILPFMRDGKYWSEINFTSKGASNLSTLIKLNKEEKDNKQDEKLNSLKEFIPDKKTRLRLSYFDSKICFKGLNYWEAVSVVYGSHSTKEITKVEILERVPNHSMNNPVVEKIVNETLLLVNSLKAKYDFDEIRIELCRELKSSREEREQIWESIDNNTEKIERAKAILRELNNRDSKNELNVEVNNKKNIDKIKLIEEVVENIKGKDFEKETKIFKQKEPSKEAINKYILWLEQHFKCPYTNKPIPLTDVFSKYKKVEIEHIIPRERYFDNSYSNKVITWKEINSLKGSRTAFEFIVSKRKDDETTLSNGNKVKLVTIDKWEEHIKTMFPKGRKQRYLLLKEIPEDPINRELKETQYINKKLKEELEKLCPNKVWTTTGSITDILRERWHLNDVMKDLMRDRFNNFKVTIGKGKFENHTLIQDEKIDKDTGELTPELFNGYKKRLDHRHHALDAIIIACTKQFHIQYLNLLNQINSADQEIEQEKEKKYNLIKKEVCIGRSSTKFNTPWDENDFIPKVLSALENTIISHKNVRLLISPSKHRKGKEIKPQKIASIRGQLHDETIYAKRNYYQGDNGKTEIEKVIKEILNRKLKNQNQTKTGLLSFSEIIKGYVFKEKYQKALIPMFNEYDNIKLSKETKKSKENNINKIAKDILQRITDKKILYNHIENKPLEWLSVFSEKNASARPFGTDMDLNDDKLLDNKTGIANPRIKRLAEYRLNFVNEKCNEIDNLNNIEKKEKDKKKSQIKSIKLFSNAIYEVRIKSELNKYEWLELKYLTPEYFENIEYSKSSKTSVIKDKLQQVLKANNQNFNLAFKDYFENPIFISQTPIQVKKARKLAWVSNLFEISPKKYVNASDTFMAYIFEQTEDENGEEITPQKRKVEFLKFIDAINIINTLKPEKIQYSELFSSCDLNKYKLLFTLAKNDLVFLPEKVLSKEEIEEINWNKLQTVSKYLKIVKDINPSQNKIIFQNHTYADSILIKKNDSKILFQNKNIEYDQKEEIKYGTIDMLQRCIKVYTDKLGKTVVPYWKFPNGSWDNEIAKKNGLNPLGITSNLLDE